MSTVANILHTWSFSVSLEQVVKACRASSDCSLERVCTQQPQLVGHTGRSVLIPIVGRVFCPTAVDRDQVPCGTHTLSIYMIRK